VVRDFATEGTNPGNLDFTSRTLFRAGVDRQSQMACSELSHLKSCSALPPQLVITKAVKEGVTAIHG
jgi:hypothetical protein